MMRSITIKHRPVALALALSAFMRLAATTAHADDRERNESIRREIRGGRAKNVILFIGDGLGDQQITMARNYNAGAAGKLALDSLPLTGAMTTYSVQELDPALPNYVPDSAATGTAWVTGFKTSNGRISTSAATDQDLETILEMAQAERLRTGIVTTAELTDATPAVLAAHVNSRRCQGPADMALCPQDRKVAEGPGSIAEQMVDHHVDVLFGGGRQRFEQVIDGGPDTGKTVVQSAQAQGYEVIFDRGGLTAAQPGKKLLGLFNPGNMSLEWNGDPAMPFPGSGPQVCAEDQRPVNEPSLADMTEKAIELLDEASPGQGRGFFLQVEGASVDKRDHAAEPCQQIGEAVAFDRAVRVALDYAKRNRNTLIIVTADHAHTAQIIPRPVESDHPGAFSTLVTADGVEMIVNYATSPFGRSQDHTGAQVRVAAQGPEAGKVIGVIDQTDLFQIMKEALGF